MEKYRITLTKEERTELEGLISKGKAGARKLAHARVLLLADASQAQVRDDQTIASVLSLGLRTISRIRKRFVTEGLHAALNHKPQPPRPEKTRIKGNVEQQLVRIACCDPPDGRAYWTLQLLADELVALGLTKKVSTETVRQALKKTILTRGSSELGACRPMLTENTSGEWRTSSKPTCCLTIRNVRLSVSMKRVASFSAKCASRRRRVQASAHESTTNTSDKEPAISS